jgi:polysaccharide deacetylase 2 family uncharacterized protein YibQ
LQSIEICCGQTRPQLAFIFDDLGYRSPKSNVTQDLLAIGCPYAVAIIPGVEHSTEIAETFHQAGKEIIIHYPMDAEIPTKPESLRLTVDMSKETIGYLIGQGMLSVPFSQGLSNHQGSLFTGDEISMLFLMEILADKGLYFLDSKTSPEAVARKYHKKAKLPLLERDVFLDVDFAQGESFDSRITKLLKIAQKRGYAIGIGHFQEDTIRKFDEMLHTFVFSDFEIVFPSQISNSVKIGQTSKK